MTSPARPSVPTTLPRYALAALLLALSGTSARADDPPPKETRFFEEYDKNLDGKVTQEEFSAGQGDASAFALLDRNKDGTITPDELGLPADFKPKPRAPGSGGTGGPAPGGSGGGQPGMPGGGLPGGGMPGAGGKGGEFRRKLKEMDVNGDGKVSREEWKGPAELFDRADVNKDGVIDAADGKGLRAPGGMGPSPDDLARRFGELDKNQDGRLVADELAAVPEPQRERLLKGDTDGDGALTKPEYLDAAKKAFRPPPPGEGGPGGPGGAPGGTPGGAPAAGPEILRRFDHDRDGKVTRDQFPGGDEQFAKLDKDGDGVLTEKDFPPPAAAQPLRIADLDKDGDGRLSRAEWQGDDAGWRAHDRNQDGWITAEELRPAK